MVISVRLSLNNMRISLCCIDFFHKFVRNVNKNRVKISKSTKY